MDILLFRGYTLETEWNDNKVRCAMYIKNNIPQRKSQDLEQENTLDLNFLL